MREYISCKRSCSWDILNPHRESIKQSCLRRESLGRCSVFIIQFLCQIMSNWERGLWVHIVSRLLFFLSLQNSFSESVPPRGRRGDIRRKINTKESSLELDKSRQEREKREKERTLRKKTKGSANPSSKCPCIICDVSAPPVMASLWFSESVFLVLAKVVPA